jgi:hypothetical protein
LRKISHQHEHKSSFAGSPEERMSTFPSSVFDLSTPPEAAHGVIAAWLMGHAASNVAYLKPKDFSEEADQTAWSLILELEKDGIVGEQGALLGRLKRTRFFQAIDVVAYWHSLMECTERADRHTMNEYAKTVHEYARRRRMDFDATTQKALARNFQHALPPDKDLEEESAARKRYSLADLLTAEFPEPHGPWPGIVPAGLTVIGARPKSGKSLLMLQLAGAVSTGDLLFGSKLDQGRVLYYALEDKGPRLQERARRMGIRSNDRLVFADEIAPLHQGGLSEVEAATDDFGLVIIDTISRAVPGKDFTKDGAFYGDYLGRLQSLALKKNVSVVLVVHTRKPNGTARDPVDDVLGSTQMTAPADSVLAIYRDQGNRSNLMGRARDTGDVSLTLEMDADSLCWKLLGKTEDIAKTENEGRILEALEELGRAQTSAIAEHVGAERSHTSMRLKKLVARGLVCKEVEKEVPVYFLPRRVEELGEE